MSATAASLIATAGIFGVGLLIGLVVLVTSEEAITAVATSSARNVAGSFWTGVLIQLLALPVLLLLAAACAITIIGILLIPVVVLAWALALAGTVTLGLLGVLLMIGRAVAGSGNGSRKKVAIRGLAVGLFVLCDIWLGAVLASTVPVVGAVTRLAAVAFTWAITTIGMGAVLRSRIGMSRISLRFGQWSGVAGGFMNGMTGRRFWSSEVVSQTSEPAEPHGGEVDGTISWMTPTPVQGVVAARRPVAQTTGSYTAARKPETGLPPGDA